jgi:hypothetical protein
VRLEQLLAAGDDRLRHGARKEALHARQALELRDLVAHALFQACIQLANLVLQRLHMQQALDAAEQLRPVHRLGDEVVGADLDALDALGLRIGRGHQDHRQQRGGGARAQAAHELVAVHARHQDVGDHQVGALGAHDVERRHGVERHLDLIAEVAQQAGHHFGVGALVVDDQDALSHPQKTITPRAFFPACRSANACGASPIE